MAGIGPLRDGRLSLRGRLIEERLSADCTFPHLASSIVCVGEPRAPGLLESFQMQTFRQNIALAVMTTSIISICYGQQMDLVVTESPLDERNTLYSVRNDSKLRIDAMIATATQYDATGGFLARSVEWQDHVLRLGIPCRLNSLDSRGFKVTAHPRATRVEFAVQAVAFEGGPPHGEPEWIKVLVNRRKATARYLDLTIERLDVRPLPEKEVLLSQLRELSKTLYSELDREGGMMPDPASSALRHVFDQAVGDLRREGYPGEPWERQVRRVRREYLNMKRDIERFLARSVSE